MKITILSDNCASRKYSAEWGLSIYIEAGTNILLDFGASDLFLKNAEKMDINIMNADYLVLSHGHWDHGNGLKYLPKKKLVCHPEAFIKRFRDGEHIGLPFDLKEGEKRFHLILTKKPFSFDENTVFLGEIPRSNDFEAKETIFNKEDGKKDFVYDDSGLAIKTEKGLIVISGCAHAGICNMVDYAIKITGIKEVLAVIGGFHLKDNDFVTKNTIEYLKSINVKKVLPTHCTEFPALVEFYKFFGSTQLHVGQVINIKDL